MSLYRDTYALVDLKRLEHNIQVSYQHQKKPMMAIIKANGYGHGATTIVSLMETMHEIEMYGVATFKEALELRESGAQKGILVLGAACKEDFILASQKNITLTLFSKDYLLDMLRYDYEKPLQVHLKIDTGMNRLGFKCKEDIDEALSLLDERKICMTGVFTHYACADEDEESYLIQFEKFKQLSQDLDVPYKHAANSAASLYYQEDYTNMVRCGISIYGVDPAGHESLELQQVMSLWSKVVMVKKIHAGEKVGYGFTYEAQEDQYIATLPLGYADGFIRANQGRCVYIRGHHYPIVGRVCMDQMMVKVDEHVQVGDEVEIFGDHISLATMAKELHTIPYEIVCLLSLRIPRLYKK